MFVVGADYIGRVVRVLVVVGLAYECRWVLFIYTHNDTPIYLYHPRTHPQGAIIAKGFDRVGSNGQVVIEESPTMLDEIDFTEVRV